MEADQRRRRRGQRSDSLDGEAQEEDEEDREEQLAGPEVGARATAGAGSPSASHTMDRLVQAVLFPSPAGGGGALSQSPSFCIEPDGRSASFNQAASNQLTASDVFSRSKNFIKRPSTMMATDALTQVAQALESSSAANRPSGSSQRQQSSSSATKTSSVRRSRRQAIVPPKLATDATSSESECREPEVGQLVDVGADEGEEEVASEADQDAADDDDDHDGANDDGPPSEGRHLLRARARPEGAEAEPRREADGRNEDRHSAEAEDEEEALSRFRRKRSGGDRARPAGGLTTSGRRSSDGRANLPTFHIEQDLALPMDSARGQQRPDSQATNAESIVSSGSSTTLSAFTGGRLSGASGAMSPAGNCSAALTVPLGNGSARRRSSIAVIPQMQICPGDLLVYSKQLIDRMNQSDENGPPQFLTIDDKKAKNNLWSSFKLVSLLATSFLPADEGRCRSDGCQSPSS